MDYFGDRPHFNTLSLMDLLKARDQFHPHLLHKANVVGTAIGRYLIRKSDPYPSREEASPRQRTKPKPPRTLENSEVREYSWPAVLVFVSEWVHENEFGAGRLSAADFIPKTIYLDDGRSVPVCVVQAPRVETAPPPVDPGAFKFPLRQISGGYPVISRVQNVERVASLGCLVTDGHRIYALTNRHVAGRPGEELFTSVGGERVLIGRSSRGQLGRIPFQKLYETWPGRHIYVNMDIGLIEIEDQTRWSPAVYGIGQLGPLADLSVYNLTLSLIGCPVRAYGCASGRLFGRIAALFYRYKSVGGFEYVADFLIGSRDDSPLLTRPGDSGTIWVTESEDVEHDLMPIAVQWGGTVFEAESAQLPFALATNLSNVCRELDVELFRARGLAAFEYWESVGHFSIGSFACTQVADPKLKALMMANRRRVSFDPEDIDSSVNFVTVPGFVPLANVPDKVWKKVYDPSKAPYGRKGPENPNHYADLDYKPDGIASLDELTPDPQSLKPETWRAYYDAIKWKKVSQRGLLPFRVWQIYKQMVEFVAEQRMARFVAAAGVLAHYVGDACQPLHGSYLSDGDPFRHPDGSPSDKDLGLGNGYGGGIHEAFEGDMLDSNVEDLLSGLAAALGDDHGMNLVRGGREAGFATIELMRRSRDRIRPVDLVETYGKLLSQGKKSQASAILWDRFGEQTIEVVADGARTLAMLWESAWVEGGGQNVSEDDLFTRSTSTLKKIYDSRSFLTSAALGPSTKDPTIDKYL